MADGVKCPRSTTWCTEHQSDGDQCVSVPIDVSASCNVWLVQEIAGVEPMIAVDVVRGVTLTEAGDLLDALGQLRQAGVSGTGVPS